MFSGEKPYECDVCRKTFADNSNLVKHKKTHAPNDGKDADGADPGMDAGKEVTLVTTDGASIVSVIRESIDAQVIPKADAGGEEGDMQQIIYIAYDQQQQNADQATNGVNVSVLRTRSTAFCI